VIKSNFSPINKIYAPVILAGFVIFLGIMTGKLILANKIILFVGIIFLVFVFLLYHKCFECLILFLFIINGEFFYLLPRLGNEKNYQDALFPVILFIGVLFFIHKKAHRKEITFFVFGFFGITLLGVLQAYFYGQPIILGLKASKNCLIVLIYFVFHSKDINARRLFDLIIIAGVCLAVLNNVQFVLFDKTKIFYYENSLMRAGELRYFVGGFFIMFAPMVAFSMYLSTKKKIYLIAAIYVLATVVIQGKGRAVMFGFCITLFGLLYLAGRLNFKNMVLIGVPSLVIFLWSVPILQQSFLGKIVELSKTEIASEKGNVSIRKVAYAYYTNEFLKSPFIGRGIWNDLVRKNNPENMKHKGLYLSDIGIMHLFFHFGLLGGAWFVWVVLVCIKQLKIVKMRSEISYYVISAYFMFSLSTIVTLDELLSKRTIIFFALIMALISQNSLQYKEKHSIE